MRQHADSDGVIAPADASVAGEESIADESRRRQVSRRRLIKGAAAVGVGVGVGAAVWSSPTIRTLGQTPAYAATCTVPFTYFASGWRNVDASCAEGPNDPVGSGGVRYHSPINNFHLGGFDDSGPVLPGFEVNIISGGSCGAESCVCSCPNTVPVTITVPVVDGQPVWECFVSSVRVRKKNGTTCVSSNGFSIPVTVLSGKKELPLICGLDSNCAAGAEWGVLLECVPDGTTCTV